MKRCALLIVMLSYGMLLSAQTFIPNENDTTVTTEYDEGRLWAYQQIEDCLVGMTNYKEKDNYGRYYKIEIFIHNLGYTSITFDPEEITSSLQTCDGDTIEMKVYTYEQYMKKVKKKQNWTMFVAGFNAGSAGYQTTYSTTYGRGRVPYTQVHRTYNHAAAANANLLAQTGMTMLRRMMDNDRKIISQGYLKKTTIHPGEGITGYINIKRKRGTFMTIHVPIDGVVYSFDWDVSKKK